MIARELGHQTLMCTVLDKSEEDAPRLILDNARSRNYLNAFCCYALALTQVEPLAAQARENRVLGGRKKQLAKLPKDQKIDVRKEAALLAGRGERNVDKVRLVLEHGIDRLNTVAREGTISINAAAKLTEKDEDGAPTVPARDAAGIATALDAIAEAIITGQRSGVTRANSTDGCVPRSTSSPKAHLRAVSNPA